jgi:outer membrane protein assembly factor BamB
VVTPPGGAGAAGGLCGAAGAVGQPATSDKAARSLTDAAGNRIGTIDNFGPASRAGLLQACVLSGSTLHVASRAINPPLLGAFDLVARTFSSIHPIPSGGGAWALTSHDDSIYVGMTRTPDLYRLHTPTGSLTRVARLPGAPEQWIWSATASEDGRIYVGAGFPPALYEYDPATRVVREILSEPFVGGGVHAIVVDESTIYAGGVGEHHAELVAIDRRTGRARSVLPTTMLERDAKVTRLAIDRDWLLVGVDCSPSLVMVSRRNGQRRQAISFADDVPGIQQGLTALTAADGEAFFTDREHGALHRCDLADGAIQKLTTPHAGDVSHGLAATDQQVIGISTHGSVWSYDRRNGRLSTTEVAPLGFAGRQAPHSIAARPGRVYIGTNHSIDIHASDLRSSTKLFLPDGEPKAMVAVEGRLYAAVYPNASLWQYVEATKELTRLAVIGHHQQRPRDIHHDPVRGLLLIGTAPVRGQADGALVTYHLKTAQLRVMVGFAPGQSIRALTSDIHAIYVGSESSSSPAQVQAYEPLNDRRLWQVVPVPDGCEIRSLAAFDRRIVGLTGGGTLFTVDAATGAVLQRSQLDAMGGDLSLLGGRLYATVRDPAGDTSRLYKIDPGSGRSALLMAGPAARFNDYPRFGDDHAGSLYLIEEFDLLRFSPD